MFSQFYVPVQLFVSNTSVSLFALIDFGSAGNFISSALVTSLSIPIVRLASSVSVKALNGHLGSNGLVTQITQLLQISFHPSHTEHLQFYALPHTQPTVIFGLPWLRMHNPIIDWQSAKISSWSPQCLSHSSRNVTLQVTTIKSPNVHLPIDIPPEYMAMIEVFNVVKAARFSPHRPWDCAINLLPVTTPPRSRVYPLSLVETKAMEDYVEEELRLGLISRSTLPASNSFFLRRKTGVSNLA